MSSKKDSGWKEQRLFPCTLNIFMQISKCIRSFSASSSLKVTTVQDTQDSYWLALRYNAYWDVTYVTCLSSNQNTKTNDSSLKATPSRKVWIQPWSRCKVRRHRKCLPDRRGFLWWSSWQLQLSEQISQSGAPHHFAKWIQME